jgi:hypothetical protein
MRDSKAIQIVAALVTMGAVAAMMIAERGGFATGVNAAPHRAAGAELARQALSLMKPGGRITVITRDTTAFQNPASDFLLEGFQRELRRAHASISDIHRLQVDPLRLIEVPPGDFQDWIHHAAAGDVIVSFMGPPLLTAEQRRQLGEIQPTIVAFCPGGWPDRVDFRPLFAQGLLRAAIVSRCDQRSATVHSQKFDQNFTVVTAANVDDFMAAAGKPATSKSP